MVRSCSFFSRLPFAFSHKEHNSRFNRIKRIFLMWFEYLEAISCWFDAEKPPVLRRAFRRPILAQETFLLSHSHEQQLCLSDREITKGFPCHNFWTLLIDYRAERIFWVLQLWTIPSVVLKKNTCWGLLGKGSCPTNGSINNLVKKQKEVHLNLRENCPWLGVHFKQRSIISICQRINLLSIIN